MFLDYLKQEDFVGVSRYGKEVFTYGFTRARRYWNHSSVNKKKWTRENGKWEILPKDHNVERFFGRSSNIFKDYWKQDERTKIIVK